MGVAISTTGDYHRLSFLETAMVRWAHALPEGSPLFVTVDGPEAAVEVVKTVRTRCGMADRVQIIHCGKGRPERDGRQGVAVNKNTGLEALMDRNVHHLFLSDDDTWPRRPASLDLHTNMAVPHSMVCWGGNRLESTTAQRAFWSWPRGVVLYVERAVVREVGGMVEEFGFGGHEHVEWSRRIHQHGFTQHPYTSPIEYADRQGKGAIVWWHGADMRAPGESQTELGARRREQTSVRRLGDDWGPIKALMEKQDGNTAFVPFRAAENGRAFASITH